ncbi:MAG: type II secretion system protein GspK [Candidatus Aceula meridiana]|nr:type II secretion system protein GspK [Candidatus Aceula meridiana]
MKFNILRLRLQDNSGIIMIVTLWILIILSVLAVGLGRRTSLDLALTKYSIARAKAMSLAWGALTYSMNEIRKDSEDDDAEKFDSFYQCGFYLPEESSAEEIFENRPLGDGFFDVRYKIEQGKGADRICYGFEDEERRLNLNSIYSGNYKVLYHLIVLLGFDEATALTISCSVVDWHDDDSIVTEAPHGAEDDYYVALIKPYRCKNTTFETIEELLLVKGVTKEIFDSLKDYVTVFPLEARDLKVNINTVKEDILKAIFRATAERNPGAEELDADSLTQKIVSYRLGEDAMACTADDRIIEKANSEPLSLNQSEQAIFLSAVNHFIESAQYFRITVHGYDEPSGVKAQIQAVVDREDLTILRWRRN